ncbi:DUF3810 domain-containing protein [Acidaminobacter hydrogenoformans]|uniref:DUF3810 domain-containing protein n=1 Tax=Acidaminobacter hydrogenoformans DSM 2784 TaxID=1120920 RepID=A0A1G5RWR3_9FIRM|nr:DUF3810 domain-containing protein [Acidaminobacter hydrogenoformans]SCZ77749.1 Protein of unknown function [Acidaminobacter hydrogenoformans DSM 2784]
MGDVLFRIKKLPKSALWIALAPAFYGLGHWLERHPEMLEAYYAGSIQKSWMQLISSASGVLPFSLAELLFLTHLLAIPVLLIMLIIKLFRGGAIKLVYQILAYTAMLYVLFMLAWGLNYSRQPLAATLGYDVRPYAIEELYALSELLIDQANQLRVYQATDPNGVMRLPVNTADMFSRTAIGYQAIEALNPIFQGIWGPPKAVVLSEAMLYTGITGVFMPFTGEANINVRVPDLLLPAIAMHEKAHQMGIAREDEANYAAYLACMSHPDLDFQYSGTVLALIHTTNALYREAPELYFELRARYSEDLKRDLAAYSAFWKPYQGKVNDTADQINDTYLKTNRQQDGVKSYGRMVDLLLADFLSTGSIAAAAAPDAEAEAGMDAATEGVSDS